MTFQLTRAGVGQMRSGQFEKAVGTLQRAAQARPKDARILLQLGLAQLEHGDPPAARSTLERALELDANFAPGHYYLVLALLECGDFPAAQQHLSELERLSPDNQALPTLRCWFYLRQSQLDQALVQLELPPSEPSPLWKRPELACFPPLTSRLIATVEEWLLPQEIPVLQRSEALSEAPEVPQPEPRQPPPERVRASWIGLVSGCLVGALGGLTLRALLRAVVGPDIDYTMGWQEPIKLMGSFGGLCGATFGFLRPSLPDSYYAYFTQLRGYRFLDRAMRTEAPHQRRQYFMLAVATMRRARELDPLMLRASYGLGEALLLSASSLHDPEISALFLPEAEDCFLQSWALDGENPYLNYYLGRCCQLQGKIEAAVTYYERAIAKFSKLAEGHYGLGQCLLLLGRKSEGRGWLARALSSELQMGRDRLLDLSHAFSEGLSHPPAMPELPPPPPQPEPEPPVPVSEPGAPADDGPDAD